jgi:hypothetical protein
MKRLIIRTLASAVLLTTTNTKGRSVSVRVRSGSFSILWLTGTIHEITRTDTNEIEGEVHAIEYSN